MPLQPHLRRLMEAREPLSQAEARDVMHRILTSALPGPHPALPHPASPDDAIPDPAIPDPASPRLDLQIAALLGALAARPETAAEIAGFAESMRSNALTLPLTPEERSTLVDSCGTGGDSSGTFNISTAAALVAAAAGATVAKHGNRAVTSRSGSADVLEALGIPIDHTPATAAAALRQHRFAFLHAPALHPTMRAVMPVRRALGVRTLFNLVGPLTNPAGAARQLMGVFSPHLVPVVAEAMLRLGTIRALVVCGEVVCGEAPPQAAGQPSLVIDELSLSGPTRIAELHDGAVREWTLHPEDLGLHPSPIDALRGGDAITNARILQAIFAGETGPRHDITALNAAAVLFVAGLAPDLPSALDRARLALSSGATAALVHSLAATAPAQTSR